MTYETPIVFGTDDRYARYMAVSLASLLFHATAPLNIHCIIDDLQTQNVETIQSVVRGTPSTITFHKADAEDFTNWQVDSYFSKAAYYKLLIPSMIDGARALWLDSDLVVTCDIQELLDIDLQDHWIGACAHPAGAVLTPMPLRKGEAYINSGVMLLNLDALRRNDFFARCAEVHQQYRNFIRYVDQCVINKAAEGQKLLIEPRWNICISDYRSYQLERQIGHCNGSSIIHACGEVKPWMQWSDLWLTRLWLDYARLTDLAVDELLQPPIRFKEILCRSRALDTDGQYKEASALKEKIISHLLSKLQQAR